MIRELKKPQERLEIKEKLEKYLKKKNQECVNGTEHLKKKVENEKVKNKMCQWK